MARKRMIDPNFWECQDLGKAKRDVRLFFLGLISLSNDLGIIRGDPLYLLRQIFPYDEDLKKKNIEEWLSYLDERRMIYRYNAKGNDFILLTNFHKYQVLDKPSRSKYPIPDIDSLITQGILSEDSANTLRRLGELSGKTPAQVKLS